MTVYWNLEICDKESAGGPKENLGFHTGRGYSEGIVIYTEKKQLIKPTNTFLKTIWLSISRFN